MDRVKHKELERRPQMRILCSSCCNFALLLGAILSFSEFTYCLDEGDYSEATCSRKVQDWAHAELARAEGIISETNGRPQRLKPLLFFLHIPRTGGRTYHQCFLKALYPPEERCSRSYDVLRVDPSRPQCRLLATHNDYSLLGRLPAVATSVVTNMRDPVARILSAYEFSVEIGLRPLARTARGAGGGPRKPAMIWQRRRRRTSRRRLLASGGGGGGGRGRGRAKNRTETRKVWPWEYLVPWMESDLRARRTGERPEEEEQQQAGQAKGPYNMPHLVMPLSRFVEHPLAQALLHNGATLQVAGLTNNSVEAGAGSLRACLARHPPLGAHALAVAKARLRGMLHVGLTEAHEDTARLFAAAIGRDARSAPAFLQQQQQQQAGDVSTSGTRRALLDGASSPGAGGRDMRQAHTSLLAHYQQCVKTKRRVSSWQAARVFKLISPIRFSKESRARIPEGVVARIRALNALDVELHEFARGLFREQQRMLGSASDETLEEEEKPGPVLAPNEFSDAGERAGAGAEQAGEQSDLPHWWVRNRSLQAGGLAAVLAASGIAAAKLASRTSAVRGTRQIVRRKAVCYKEDL